MRRGRDKTFGCFEISGLFAAMGLVDSCCDGAGDIGVWIGYGRADAWLNGEGERCVSNADCVRSWKCGTRTWSGRTRISW